MPARPAEFIIKHRVYIEADEIEVLAELPAKVDIGKAAKVVKDEPVRVHLPQYQHLIMLERGGRIGQKPVKILHMAG